MWIEFKNNPVRSDGVGDCSVRAISKALDISWEDAYVRLALNGYLMGDVPSSDIVWGSVLRQNGFSRSVACPECYTVAEFCEDHPNGIYVIKSPGHVATVVDGDLYDSWDSSNQTVIYYWKE